MATARRLAEVNRLRHPDQPAELSEIELPDSYFSSVPEGLTLHDIDDAVGLRCGSNVTVGRVFCAHPPLPYPGETVAVPTPELARRQPR